MPYDFRTQRLFVAADLAAGTRLEASREQANYLLNVLRLHEGDAILLFNGRDGEWRACIADAGRKACVLVPEEQTREQTPLPDLHYLFAPLKHARLDYMVQKAVEMGAGASPAGPHPVHAGHRVNLDRMQANAIEAAEQCGILAIPEIDEPRQARDVARRLGSGRAG